MIIVSNSEITVDISHYSDCYAIMFRIISKIKCFVFFNLKFSVKQ